MSTGIVVAIIVGFVAFMILGRGKRIDSAQARQLVENGAVLVDVRSPGEFKGGAIKGAINIPHTQITSRAAKDIGGPDTVVVLYCASGMRSGAAMAALKGAGYAEVHNLGPMSAW